MADNSVEPSSIPGAPSASADSSPASVEPSSIPTTTAGPLRSVVQESFDPPTSQIVVDRTLNSGLQASEDAPKNK